jgi:glutaconyl-CoA/methylmalonyl-CoA decarboxylase subunit gamma
MRKLRVTVDGKPYEVVVEEMDGAAPAPAGPVAAASAAGASVSAPSAPAPSAGAASAGPGEVPSPLAGRVVSINCKVGESVEAGATLITLEAMKMNTFVQAPAAGKVEAVLVKEGDGVEEGQPLVKLQ